MDGLFVSAAALYRRYSINRSTVEHRRMLELRS